MAINDIYSLIAALFVGGVAGYVGSLMVTKRMSLAGDALGHIALPGMGLALLWKFNVSVGALVFLLVGVLLVWYLEHKTSLATEALVGVIFVLSLAIGLLITPELELLEALMGDISRVTHTDAIIAIVVSLFVFWAVTKIYEKLMLAFISEDLAKVNKIDSAKYNLWYLLLVAIVVALGVKVVGSLLVGALVVVPAAAARNVSGNMKQYAALSVVFGIVSAGIGILATSFIRFPAGPLVVLASIVIFAVSLLFRKKS